LTKIKVGESNNETQKSTMKYLKYNFRYVTLQSLSTGKLIKVKL